jgi:exopolysaccharide production protein ExoZ
MLINIQLLRFIAALLVVLHHSSDHLQASGHELGPVFEIGRATGFGGVDIFFVISGFIMAWTTTASAGAADAVAFIKRRVARIYSGYWPFFLFALTLFYVFDANRLVDVQILRSALLWPTKLDHLMIPVSWTLIFEMFFYFLFALLIGCSGARRTYVISWLAVAVLGWTIYSHFGRHAYDPGELERISVYENYWAYPFLLEFLAGAILAEWLRRTSNGSAWLLVLAGIVLWLTGGWLNDSWFSGKLSQGYFVIWRVLIFGGPAVLLVAGLVRLERSGRTFMPRFGVLAGGASYAIYLSHTLILMCAHGLGLNRWVTQFPAWAAQLVFVCVVALIVAYSVAHYLWLERPLHQIFRRCLKS